jgi:ATP-binding cassette subfamily C (CFTR/MRP) protein 4
VNPPQSPETTRNIFCSYSFDLFKKGFKKDLDEDDLYEVLTSCRSKTLGDLLETQWEVDKKKNKRPSLVRVLWACFGKTYMMYGVMQLIMRTVLVYVAHLLHSQITLKIINSFC